MENISEIIKNRRATPPRFLAKTEVEREIIIQMLENANWAPTHKNTEPWRFRVYTGAARKKLAHDVHSVLKHKAKMGEEVNPQKMEKLISALENVPVVIAVIFHHDEGHRVPEWEELAAVSMAVQNMWLTATANGLGAFWSTPEFKDLLGEILEIQSDQQFLGFFYVGHILMEFPSPGRGAIEEKTVWVE